ncbi:MAG: protogloblin ApPgb [Acidobacteria bacterium]|nr:protogloblin ApPgb [Acidobacteriota bacterium]
MDIPGYTFGTAAVTRSPITLAEFERMKHSVAFSDDDVRWLRTSRTILEPQVEAVLDVWYGFVGSQPHLVAAFGSVHDGMPLADYLAAVRRRFGRWILDTADARYDQQWLDYQHEIGRRHHRLGKNQTDGAAAVSHIPFRDLFLLVVPITATLTPFLAIQGHDQESVQRMHDAWVKSCLLQVTLWSHPYVKDGDF